MAKKIIVVDDEQTVRQQVRQALSPGGFEIVEANDGLAGLRELVANPDTALMICDVYMPRMNGLDMIEAVRDFPAHRKPPIVMLTTAVGADQAERAKAAGARGWVVKPFKPEQLLAMATRLTRA